MTHTFDLSIRTIMVLITGFLGIVALTLTLLSGAIQEQHFFNNQHLSMQKLIHLKSEDLLRDLTHKSSGLALGLQANESFQQAFASRDISSLVALMDNQFHDYYVTTSLLKLEQLSVFDSSLSQLAEKNSDRSSFTSLKQACPELFLKAAKRTGPEKMKLFSGLCLYNKQPFHLSLIPVGGLRLKGYIAAISDPTHNLRSIESALGMPLTILDAEDKIIFQSDKGPQREALSNSFISQYQLNFSDTPQDHIYLEVADDIRPLYGALPQTRTTVMTAALIITLACVYLVMRILDKTTLQPLNKLTIHLRQLRSKQKTLGEKVRVDGTKEIQELSTSFNEMTEELGKLYGTLEKVAFTDDLTTLPNRNSFQNHLQHHMGMNKPFALLIMDMNHFKSINDTLGHHIGDMLLMEVGHRLEKTLRSSDFITRLNQQSISGLGDNLIARLGGDEFSAILPDIHSPESAEIAANKIANAMEEPFHIDGHKLVVAMSTGIALFPLHSTERHDLVSKADVAMYHAKETKQNFALYDESYDHNSLRHLTLNRDLHNGIKEGQLLLHYQPKVNLQNGQVCGTEALVRWRHPELGMIPPDEFISLAEQSGLIRQLTAWVLNRALQDSNLWHKQGHDIGVSVNLSALNLRDRNLCDDIRSLMDQWSIKPSQLILELTESTVMADPAHALTVLTMLNGMGIGLSIDDFGTGYSSLTYIKKLPVTEIKIDKSFVREMCENNGDDAIIRSVVVLAHHLKLSLVAEGVEDETGYDYLKQLGCGIVQGYYIAKPMPVEDYIKWLANSRWKKPLA